MECHFIPNMVLAKRIISSYVASKAWIGDIFINALSMKSCSILCNRWAWFISMSSLKESTRVLLVIILELYLDLDFHLSSINERINPIEGMSLFHKLWQKASKGYALVETFLYQGITTLWNTSIKVASGVIETK